MALGVYFPQDILNVLAAAEHADRTALEAADKGGEFVRGYQAGHRSALMAIALAFGLLHHENHTKTHELMDTGGVDPK